MPSLAWTLALYHLVLSTSLRNLKIWGSCPMRLFIQLSLQCVANIRRNRNTHTPGSLFQLLKHTLFKIDLCSMRLHFLQVRFVLHKHTDYINRSSPTTSAHRADDDPALR